MSSCGGQDNEGDCSIQGSARWNAQSPDNRTRLTRIMQDVHPNALRSINNGEADQAIASALQSLSLEDRNEIFQEIHGISSLVEETPEVLNDSFTRLRQELFRIVHSEQQPWRTMMNQRMNCQPFRKAEQLNRNYTHSRFHYLMFLRSENFNIREAAIRMIYFFQLKQYLFGDERLCIDIHQGMLSKEELNNLKNGFIQVVPSRDRSGRVLMSHFFNLIQFDHPKGLGRMYMYMSWIVALDEESQKKGCVLLQWDLGQNEESTEESKSSSYLFEQLDLHLLISNGCPVRVAAVHNCLSDQRYLIIKWGFKFAPKDLQARNKFHSGTPQECVYSMMSYGIPPDIHPITVDGEVKSRRHREWLRSCAILEGWIQQGKLPPASLSPRTEVRQIVIVPGTDDVLLGRGRRVMVHPANILLNQLVDEYMVEYQSGTKEHKTFITQRLMERVKKEFNGRFLEQDASSGVWLIASDENVRLRVSQRFRTRKQEQGKEGYYHANFEDDGPLDASKTQLHKRLKTNRN